MSLFKFSPTTLFFALIFTVGSFAAFMVWTHPDTSTRAPASAETMHAAPGYAVRAAN